jgi:hypothetical protein
VIQDAVHILEVKDDNDHEVCKKIQLPHMLVHAGTKLIMFKHAHNECLFHLMASEKAIKMKMKTIQKKLTKVVNY